MKKFNLLLLLVCTSFVSFAQFTQTSYRGAFAPAPTAMWTDSWTNFDPQNTVYPTATVTVGNGSTNPASAVEISTDTTWSSNNTYLVSGLVFVTNGATLTIQAGTKILGDANGSALVITKGSKINAVGTATNPIVFTSDKAVGSRAKGDWGGVIILGNAAFNLNGGTNYIEGIANDTKTLYGGGATPNNTDNSGTLKYVRIEYAGYAYALNNEINGLTMGAVGSGTTIDYVQVSHSNDDSFEWFGGSVNCKHLIAYRGLDDDFDTDNGYSGNVQFGLGVRDPQVSDNPAVSTSEGFESDNNASSTSVSPYTSAIFSNMTMVGPSYRKTLPNAGSFATGYKRAARLRRNTKLQIFNSVFMDYEEGVHIDGVTTETNALNNELKFANNIIAGTITTAKVTQVNTSGNNSSFNVATWYAASNNTTLTTNSGILTSPYNVSDATTYTGRDYRPATNSPLLDGVNFTDASFTGKLDVIPAAFIAQTSYRGAFAPAPVAQWTTGWTNFDPQNTVYPTATVTVGNGSTNPASAVTISTNTTWSSNNTYLVSGLVFVTNGATLTIQAGTKILGDANGSALVITKGSKINAVGTATNPIVFTSDKAVGARAKGDWGGVIILGNGAFNLNGGTNYIEGIANDTKTLYGGGATPNNADNSGTLKYVRIEYAGYAYALNNEINGLTMGAVGSGTTIDYVQVSHSNDDSFEWFGGSVNCAHLIAYRGLDDDFDTDNGYSGNVQFGLGVRDNQVSDNPAVSTSEGFESDNNASSTSVEPYTSAIFSNMTMVGPSYRKSLPNAGTFATGYKRAARLRRNTKLKIYNSIFMDYEEGVHVDGVTTETNALNGELRFNNNIIAGTINTAKVTQVNTSGNNSSFNVATWYAANNNTTLTTNAGILTMPYDATSALIYTGLDYRPATGSPALDGAAFDSYVATKTIPTTKLATTSCGVTLATINTTLAATAVTGASGYRFQVYDAVNGIRTYDATSSSFNLTQLTAGAAYAATYAVKVAAKVEGLYGAYGAACNVTTPAIPALTKVRSFVCGTTLALPTSSISCDAVYLAEGFKFEVTDLSDNSVRTIETVAAAFQLSNLVGGAKYNTSYSIRVAAKYNGTYGAYGTSCTVSTPVNPALTKVRSFVCGTTLALATSSIPCDAVYLSDSYKFEITDLSDNSVRFYETANSFFNFTLVSGGAKYNTTYAIRVAARVNGSYGDYGVVCNVSTPVIPPLTKVRSFVCGTTLALATSSIPCDQVYLGEGYKFEITDLSDNTVRYSEGTLSYFTLNSLVGGAKYNTTYAIRAAAKVGGVYGDYGVVCNVMTPADAPASKVRSFICGTTLATATSSISCDQVYLADRYSFEITNTSNNNLQYLESATGGVSLASLVGGAAYNTTYSIRVSRRINGTFGAFGVACNVTTPATAPYSNISSTQCGTTLVALNSLIVANSVYGATKYSFEVTVKGETTARYYETTASNFNLTKLTGGAAYNTTYVIRVYRQYNNIWEAGNACEITTPAARLASEELAVAVKAYPNPFVQSFNLDFTTVSNDAVSVSVYDMVGKTVETRTLSVEELMNQDFGSNYSAGVYNVVLTQGSVTKSFKVVKN